jgi:hypothetical protein
MLGCRHPAAVFTDPTGSRWSWGASAAAVVAGVDEAAEWAAEGAVEAHRSHPGAASAKVALNASPGGTRTPVASVKYAHWQNHALIATPSKENPAKTATRPNLIPGSAKMFVAGSAAMLAMARAGVCRPG